MRAALLPVAGLAVSLVWPAPGASGQAPDAIDRLLSPGGEAIASYVATRRLEAASPRLKQQAWIEATTAVSDGRLSYQVTRRAGSETIVRRVLLAALDKERDLLARDRSRGALSHANYIFHPETATSIRIVPRRNDPLLVNGRVQLTETGELSAVEGLLAKSPSFWTSNVRIERLYRRIAGVRAPVRMTSSADVRFAGRATFSMTYTYLEINGRAVSDAPEAGAMK